MYVNELQRKTVVFCFFSAIQPAKVWALERKVFQAIMVRTGMERLNARIEFLRRYGFYVLL